MVKKSYLTVGEMGVCEKGESLRETIRYYFSTRDNFSDFNIDT